MIGHAKDRPLSAGPWRATLRRFGYVIHDAGGRIVATIGSGGHVTPDQKRDAVAIAAVPDMLPVLLACESYFGDLPSKDVAARELHGRVFEVLVEAGVPVLDDEG